MTGGAGFAAVLAIGEATMRRMVRVLYVTNKIDHAVALSVPVPGLGTLAGTLLLGLPTLTFADLGDDRVTLDLHLWGTARTPIPLTVEISGRVTVPMTASITGRGDTAVLGLGIRGEDAVLAAPTLRTDPPLPPAVAAQLTNAALVALLQPVIRAQLAGQSTAPLSLALLGGLTRGRLAPQVRVADGVLLVGVDVTWTGAAAALGTSTHGDPAELRDIRRDGDVAVFVPGEQLPAVFVDVALRVGEMVAAQKATLDSLSLTPVRGGLRVHAVAHDDDGSADITFDVVPVLTVDPFDERKERVRIEPRNVDVTIDPTLRNKVLAGVLGVLTLGWAGIRAQELADSMRASIVSGIQAGGTDVGARTTWFTLPGTTRPNIRLRVQQYTIGPGGSRVQISIRPLLPRPGMLQVARRWLDADGAHVQVHAVVDNPPDVLADDPQLRFAWSMTRDDTGEVLADGDEERFGADVTMPGEQQVPAVTLACSVRRVLATGTRTLYETRRAVVDRGVIDRRHPYVRWVHHSVVDWAVTESDGSITRTGLVTIPRRSAIHRTDVPGGCLFVEPQGESSGLVEYTYLDVLPFAESELEAHREQVCDYCFFGGPTRTTPLPRP